MHGIGASHDGGGLAWERARLPPGREMPALPGWFPAVVESTSSGDVRVAGDYSRRRPLEVCWQAEVQTNEAFWNLPLGTLAKSLDTTPDGLSQAEARRRLARYGPNDPSPPRHYSALGELIRLLLNPLVLILLVASVASALLGDLVGSLIVTVIVLISLVLDFYQTHRSQAAAQRLAQLIVTTATVRRDGKLQELPFADLVPGDVIALSAGDLVPADCRLLKSRFLAVNQAALTGESLAVDKEAVDLEQPVEDVADARNAVFLGSSVVSGNAEALVVATGASTELGHIGRFLRAKPPSTEFEHGMQSFANLIARTVAILVLFVFLVNAWFGRPALESFLFAVALAVGLTPEFMPMIVTVTLGEAALRMAKKRVIVRHLQAIQNFGAIDILCSDKTGTLTEGTVEVAHLIAPFDSDRRRLAELAYLNASLVTGTRNPLDEAICRLPDGAPVLGQPGRDGPNGEKVALVATFSPGPSHQYSVDELLKGQYEKVDELPFDFVRRRVSVVVRRADGQSLLVAKGAPESILAVCGSCEAESGRVPLTGAELARIEEIFHQESQLGYRSLAVAYRELDGRPAYSIDDEKDLTFVGLVSFEDPPLSDVSTAIAELKEHGIRLKILTGDDPLIAAHVCQRVGLDIGRIVTGAEIDRLGDIALGAAAENVTLFARLTPIQKNRIIAALKTRGHVVGFLGDGINDAPSLHSADVGISVSGAVDVAREAAEIILLEKSLAVLHDGIVEGRKSFGNIMKYIMMGTSSNFGNMFSMAGATLFLPFLPLLPVQILLNNLLYDVSQLTLPTDEVDPEFMGEPKKWNMRLVRDFMLIFGPISSIFDYLTFGVMWFAFRAAPELFRTGWFMESLATQILVIYVIRTARPPWLSRPSRILVVSTLLAVALGLVLPLTPLAPYLGFASPPRTLYLFVIAAVAVYLGLVEMGKRWFFRHHHL
jgi:Mg2+-importing ATPase